MSPELQEKWEAAARKPLGWHVRLRLRGGQELEGWITDITAGVPAEWPPDAKVYVAGSPSMPPDAFVGIPCLVQSVVDIAFLEQ
jgi:hypothetical protein